MTKKIILLFFLFYLFAILQTSFLVHFAIFGRIINLIFVFVVIFSFLDKESENLGLFLALIGGLFLDIFSSNYIGFYVLILFSISLFIKLALKKYVRIPV